MSLLRGRIQELAKQHGSLRAAARVLEIDHAYLHRLQQGDKTEPSTAVLRKLGLRRVVTYVRLIKNDPANYLTRSKLVQQKVRRADRNAY
jgi:hypothetical protein